MGPRVDRAGGGQRAGAASPVAGTRDPTAPSTGWPRRIQAWAIRLSERILERAVASAPRHAERRRRRGRLRSLWGATPILTLPLKARADRMLGLESESLVFTTYYISQQFDWNLRRLAGAVGRLAPGLRPALDNGVLAWAVRRYDLLHFFHDRGLMQPAGRFGIRAEELAIYRRAGKPVYLLAYGADVRTREATLALGRWNFCTECPEPGAYCICSADEGQRLAGTAALATAAIGMADMVGYVPDAVWLDYWPVDTEHVTARPPTPPYGPLRIAHAPNHTHFKGTRHLLQAIESLRSEGHAIEIVIVQGVPNTEVLRRFAEADIVADQLIGGAYGYTALEAMALAKPVLSYVRDPGRVEAAHECPVINATPTTLPATLRWCLANREQLAAIGRQGRAYVERWHTISAVAERLGRLYARDPALGAALGARIVAHARAEAARREAVVAAPGWAHPFHILDHDSPVALAGELVLPARQG